MYAVTRYDEGGWPVQRVTYAGDQVATQVDTAYARDEEGRVVSSEVVGGVPSEVFDTGCDEVTEVVVTTYDVAQRPLETVTTQAGCGTTTEKVLTYEHFVDNERILYTAAYDADGELARYITYDKCSMVKRDDDLRYRGIYDDDCVVTLVDLRRFGWWWTFEEERPVLFDIEGTANDTAYSYEGCLSEARRSASEQRRSWLVARHHLARTSADPTAAVRDLVAMHSSDPLTLHIGLWAGVEGG